MVADKKLEEGKEKATGTVLTLVIEGAHTSEYTLLLASILNSFHEATFATINNLGILSFAIECDVSPPPQLLDILDLFMNSLRKKDIQHALFQGVPIAGLISARSNVQGFPFEHEERADGKA